MSASMPAPVYDRIGKGYSVTRRPDPRIARAIRAALGEARRIVNVGAGAGSYEPEDVPVVAVEPSWEMIRQRRPAAAPVVRAVAEALPFPAGSFDAALAVLTVHHWTDRAAGVRELARVGRRVVIVTWDPEASDRFWLTTEYLPEIVELDARRFPSLGELSAWLDPARVETLWVPADCQDGFLGAYWSRPEAYLDPTVRRAMSGLEQLPGGGERAIGRLAADLDSGAWDARFGSLRREQTADLGYRIVIAEPARP
jgi:SAM-dependent methyltransferase